MGHVFLAAELESNFEFAKQTRKSGEENVGRLCRRAILSWDFCFSVALFHLYFSVFAKTKMKKKEKTKQNKKTKKTNARLAKRDVPLIFPARFPLPPSQRI